MATGRWLSIVDGDLAGRLRESLEEVLAHLAALPFESHTLPSHTSMALLHGYLHRIAGKPADADEARRHLAAAIDHIAEFDVPPGTYEGFIGVAWATEHLHPLLYGGPAGAANEAIDEEVARLLSHPRGIASYDLVNGLVGLSVYADERLPEPAARAALSMIVTRLGERAQRDAGGARWLTPPWELPEYQRNLCPSGLFNLGMAHGIPGILSALARIVMSDESQTAARDLLSAGVEWLLAQRQPPDAEFNFLLWTGPDMKETPTGRAAWCYGDPGVAIALLQAARALSNEAWEDTAIEITRSVARKSLDESRAIDGGLCHGAAGVAHYFRRFHHATALPEFADAARVWYERLLEMRRPGEGVAGYCAWAADTVASHPYWKAETELLTGATGIALTMLAALTSVEPEWDRLIQCEIPPRPESVA